jgi:hypothetical protein
MHVTFVEAVLLRPRMYTLGGTFEEAVAFLEGYFSGMAKGNPSAAPVLQWASFRNWLSESMGVPSSEIFSRFRELHEDSHAALEKMLEWLSRFEKEQALKTAA